MDKETETIKILLRHMRTAISHRASYNFKDELLAYGYYLVGCKAVELRQIPYDSIATQKFFNNRMRAYRRALVRNSRRIKGDLKDATISEDPVPGYDLTQLTQRQQQIVQLKLAGYKSKEVAQELKLSEFVVCWELERIRAIIERQLS